MPGDLAKEIDEIAADVVLAVERELKEIADAFESGEASGADVIQKLIDQNAQAAALAGHDLSRPGLDDCAFCANLQVQIAGGR